ncbi:MAG TPA: MFS transporter [Burkholderiales bacterium]
MTLTLAIVLTVLTHVAFVGSRMTIALYGIKLGATPFTVGVLMALYAFLPMLLAVYAGRQTDRIGARRPMLYSSLGLVASVALPALWPSLAALHLAAMAIGTSFLFYHVALNNVIGQLGTPADRTVNFSWLALGFSISGFCGPLLAGFAIDGAGHRAAFLVLAAFPALAALLLYARRRGVPGPAHAQHLGGERHVKDLLREPQLRSAFIASAVLAMGWDLYTFVMPVYGSSLGLSASTIGIIMGTFAAATFTVRLAMPAFSRRLKEWPMVIAAMSVAGLSYALFPLAQSVALLMALSFLLGIGLGCAQPFIMTLLYAASPPGRQGEVIGVRTTMLNGSHTFLPLAMGALGTALGMGPVFWSMAAFLVSGAGLAWRRVK